MIANAPKSSHRDITGDQKEKFEVKFKRSKDPDSAYITCSGDVGISSSTPICPYGSIGRVAIGLPDDNPDGRGMANARDLGFSLFMDWQMYVWRFPFTHLLLRFLLLLLFHPSFLFQKGIEDLDVGWHQRQD